MPEGANVGTAYLEIVPSAQGFVGKMQREVGGDMAKAGANAGTQAATGMKKSFGSGIKNLFALAGGTALAAGAVSFVKDAFAEAREGQKVGALTTAVIKSTGGAAKVSAEQVGELAGAISKKVGIDDEAVQSGANLLLTFKNVRNETGKGNDIFNQATASMVDMAAGMAAASGGSVDFRSAATMLGKALNDPVKGLAAMSRVGVQFSKSQANSIKKMVESGNTMGAQKAILKELNAQFGGAAASQATAADKASVAWGNLKEEIGTRLLPVADRFAKWATDDLVPAMSDAVDWIDKHKDAIIRVTGALVAVKIATMLWAGAQAAVNGVIAAATGIQAAYAAVMGLSNSLLAVWVGVKAIEFAAWVRSTAASVAATAGVIGYNVGVAAGAVALGVMSAAQWVLNAAMRANPIGIIVTALVALVGGLVLAYKKSETFRNIVDGAFAAVKKAGSLMWNALKGYFRFIVNMWLSVAGALVNGAAKAFGWVPGLKDKLKNAAKAFNEFRDDVNRSLGGIKDRKVTVQIKADMPKVLTDKGIRQDALFTGRREKGGPVSARSRYLVGEAGPELFVPNSAGRIIPNHKLTGAGGPLGGGNVTIVTRIGEADVESYIEAIIDDKLRGA